MRRQGSGTYLQSSHLHLILEPQTRGPRSQVRSLDERLKQADKDAQLYNSREALLGQPQTDYSQVRSGAAQDATELLALHVCEPVDCRP